MREYGRIEMTIKRKTEIKSRIVMDRLLTPTHEGGASEYSKSKNRDFPCYIIIVAWMPAAYGKIDIVGDKITHVVVNEHIEL